MLLDEILAKLEKLPAEQLKELNEARLKMAPVWVPNIGPQFLTVESEADELFYGGSAGGGKTDVLVGLSLTKHTRSLILRRTNKEASKLVERFVEILGHRDGWNGQENTWRFPDGRVIDIGGVQHEDDKQKYKGTPHDLICWDEVSDFSETQFRFINTWNRSADQKQRCRIVCAGNPPTRAEGFWVVKYWAPWLDPTHPRPAKPGELRWFTTIGGQDAEVDGPGPHLVDGEYVRAKSRTFIPAKLSDNPDLARTNYAATLAALPPELRAAYKDGRFDAGLKDQAWQVIPTAWIIEAQDRWRSDGWKEFSMTAIGFDPAGGGKDSAELACRHGVWFAELISAQGKDTADGSAAAATIIKHRRDSCAVIVDVGGGYGGAVTLRLKDNSIPFMPFNGANRTGQKTKDRQLGFANARAEAYWRLREALDPDQPGGSPICLPPDPELRSDLAAATYEVSQRGILLESKEDLRERLGRSPGKGDAVAMALAGGDIAIRRNLSERGGGHNRPTYSNVGYSQIKKHRRRKA
jgi:hypothetical protein